MNPAHFLDNTGKQTWLFITEGKKKKKEKKKPMSVFYV